MSASIYYNGLGVRVATEQLQKNVNAIYQNNKFENGSRFMQDYMPVLIDTRNVCQRVYETEVGTTVQNDPEFVRKQYITDYTSIANRDILAVEAKPHCKVYEEGSYIQRYVYGLNGERTSAEFFYYDETERTIDLLNPGENLASDFAADDIKKIYYFRNLLDSTMLAMDREGEIITHMRYDEWGKPLEEPRLDHNFAGIKNLNNYTGYTYDYVLDLYFAQNRFYNADTRQFITQDPIKDGMNWYVYCDANPLVNVDWYGLAMVSIRSYVESRGGTVSALYYDDYFFAVTVGFTLNNRAIAVTMAGENSHSIEIENKNDTLYADSVALERYFYNPVVQTPSTGGANSMDIGIKDSTIDFLKSQEGVWSSVVQSGNTYSIGYGHDFTKESNPDLYKKYVLDKEIISDMDADRLLRIKIKSYADAVNDLIILNNLSLTQNQYDALVSFFYNNGIYVFTDSKCSEWMGYGGEYATRAEARVNFRDYLIDANGNYSEIKIKELFLATKGPSVKYEYISRRAAEADLFNRK